MDILYALVLIIFAVWALAVYPRRKKARIPVFSGEWRSILEQKVLFYSKLSPEQKTRFERNVVTFLETVIVTGVGFRPTDEDRLLVAASAVIPIFGFPGWMYRNLNEVLIYPNSFNHQYETQGNDRHIAGMVGWGAINRTMILSRDALHAGFENEHSKSNVGIHEFVHLIDKTDGAIDGIPEVLLQKQYLMPWLSLMHEEIKAIRNDASDIDPYGTVNEAEFFSVASEYFFNEPELLEEKHPALYRALEKIFRQDPANRGN
jgi:hypothetical protein